MSYMLTTLDNPYNPHVEWDRWYAYDREQGYFTSELLARIAKTSEELSETDYELEIDNAIDEVIKEDIIGLYLKVTKDFVPKFVEESSSTLASTSRT